MTVSWTPPLSKVFPEKVDLRKWESTQKFTFKNVFFFLADEFVICVHLNRQMHSAQTFNLLTLIPFKSHISLFLSMIFPYNGGEVVEL